MKLIQKLDWQLFPMLDATKKLLPTTQDLLVLIFILIVSALTNFLKIFLLNYNFNQLFRHI